MWQPEAAACVRNTTHANLLPTLCPASANSDTLRFATWVNATMRFGAHGLMTYRFWEQLMAGIDKLTCYGDNLLQCGAHMNDAKVTPSMARFDATATEVDCWVYTESADEDMTRCLQLYEARSGVALNWSTINARWATPTLNTGAHAKCDAMFEAVPELGRRIMDADAGIARAFGYSTCCGGPTTRVLPGEVIHATEGGGLGGCGDGGGDGGGSCGDEGGGGEGGGGEGDGGEGGRVLPGEEYLAPWTTGEASDVPKLAVVVSTQRGASTETAEAIGKHPCAVSLNELLGGHRKPPFGHEYNKYLTVDMLSRLAPNFDFRRNAWLPDALTIRKAFCSRRPTKVKAACGEACLVVLKMHLNNYIDSATDAPWLELITSPLTRAIVVQREALANFCSIRKARTRLDWGHTPQAQRSSASFPCAPTAASREFEKNVTSRFNVTRHALEQANRSWLELPFAEYVADPSAAAVRMLNFVGLRQPPPRFRDTCTYSWCRTYSWPNSTDLRS